MKRTKVVILAAGQGTRLRPLTDNKPKAMVELHGTPILYRQKEILRQAGLTDIFVVVGYKKEKISSPDLKLINNPDYASTNMVASLYCAKNLFDGTADIIVAYGDIIYEQGVLKSLIESKGKINVVVDRNWYALWKVRMEDPLTDAETLKTDQNGLITEIGKKPTNLKDIQGQYIGLIKVSKEYAPCFFEYYEALDKEGVLYDGKDHANMYMTTYLQLLVNKSVEVKAVDIKNGWVEIDSLDDINIYERLIRQGNISQLIAFE